MKKMFNRVCTNVTLKAMSLKQKLHEKRAEGYVNRAFLSAGQTARISSASWLFIMSRT